MDKMNEELYIALCARVQEIEVIGVKWDDEGYSGLPSNVTIDGPDFVVNDSEELDEYISDELSNEYGFTHFGWDDHRWITKKDGLFRQNLLNQF